jgi:phage regulator Rha-like protein
MFKLTAEEAKNLRSQFATSSAGHGGRRYLPSVFTEHGVAMLSSVLNSERAVQMNILIVRAFIALRKMLASHDHLARKIETLERQQAEQGSQLASVYSIVKQLINPQVRSRRRIGFASREKD